MRDTTMPDKENHPVSFRPSDETRKQLAELMRKWNENQTQAISRAIERAWQMEQATGAKKPQ